MKRFKRTKTHPFSGSKVKEKSLQDFLHHRLLVPPTPQVFLLIRASFSSRPANRAFLILFLAPPSFLAKVFDLLERRRRRGGAASSRNRSSANVLNGKKLKKTEIFSSPDIFHFSNFSEIKLSSRPKPDFFYTSSVLKEAALLLTVAAVSQN